MKEEHRRESNWNRLKKTRTVLQTPTTSGQGHQQTPGRKSGTSWTYRKPRRKTEATSYTIKGWIPGLRLRHRQPNESPDERHRWKKKPCMSNVVTWPETTSASVSLPTGHQSRPPYSDNENKKTPGTSIIGAYSCTLLKCSGHLRQ